eukprot:13510209-Heterocapsa_arctica.AAC.1
MNVQWVENLWTPFHEAMKLQIDVRSSDTRNVMQALLRSQSLILAGVNVYKNIFRSNATAPTAH